jgi:NAD(P)-dependent dehydrogenase (short-subunit alcohol dehydrogenase family)
VVVHYRYSRDLAEETVAEICSKGAYAVAVQADLADIDAVSQLIPRAAEAVGCPLSCLVNNASLFRDDQLATLTPTGWDAHINVNLRAPVFLVSTFAAQLAEGEEGNIINILDQRVLAPAPDFFSYSISKSGLHWATTTMAQALAPTIRVNAIAPGPVLMSIHQTPEEFAREQRSTLLGRGGTPEEIGKAVEYFLETPSITGQMICLDGGQHLAASRFGF